MAPLIEISPQTFTRLQAHAIPLVDNIESVISWFIDHYEAKSGTPIVDANSNGEQLNVTAVQPANSARSQRNYKGSYC